MIKWYVEKQRKVVKGTFQHDFSGPIHEQFIVLINHSFEGNICMLVLIIEK